MRSIRRNACRAIVVLPVRRGPNKSDEALGRFRQPLAQGVDVRAFEGTCD